MTYKRLVVLAVVSSLLGSFLTACNQNIDLAQIRALSQTVQAAEPSYTSIADDLYQSCLREVSWRNFGGLQLGTTKTVPPTPDGPIAYPTPTATPTVPKDPLTDESICNQYVTPVKRWKAISALLTGYFVQLGAAAADDSKVDYGFTKLVSSVGTDAGFTTAQQTSLSTFASDIATAIFAARRRQLTATQAQNARQAVDFFVSRLTDVASDYSLQLDNEEGDIVSFFKRNFVAQTAGLQPFQTLPIRTEWKSAIDEINTKRAAEVAYIDSLKALKTGNDGICDAASKNDFGAVYAAASAAVAQFKPDVVSLQKAFK